MIVGPGGSIRTTEGFLPIAVITVFSLYVGLPVWAPGL